MTKKGLATFPTPKQKFFKQPNKTYTTHFLPGLCGSPRFATLCIKGIETFHWIKFYIFYV